MDTVERLAWLRLALIPGIGPSTVRQLLERFGLPDAIFGGAIPASQLVAACGAATAAALLEKPAGALELALRRAEEWLHASSDRSIVCLADADYPAALLDLNDPPILLYAQGRRELLAQAGLAIVGSRNATRQGEQNATAFAAHLGRVGFCIISGLASGIDAAAHRGALDADCGTIALLGTGIDIVYPRSNSALAARIAQSGLLLSEYALGTPASSFNFPRRNRLIAALARGVLVVEAAVHSGSLISARLAAELGREVFAIPGSIHSPLARGCHRLIREGASLVESASDILEQLRWPGARAQPSAAPRDPPSSRAQDRTLLAALGHDPVDIDTLAQRLGCEPGSVAADLLVLELQHAVERLPGNRYQRLA